jgi:hypothetical protein
MGLKKDEINYRYILDISTGTLHDLKSEHNPSNEGCCLEKVDNWVAFDTDREPLKGALIKKLTATKEVVGLEVKSLCSSCMKPEDGDIADLLKDYFLTMGE